MRNNTLLVLLVLAAVVGIVFYQKQSKKEGFKDDSPALIIPLVVFGFVALLFIVLYVVTKRRGDW